MYRAGVEQWNGMHFLESLLWLLPPLSAPPGFNLLTFMIYVEIEFFFVSLAIKLIMSSTLRNPQKMTLRGFC